MDNVVTSLPDFCVVGSWFISPVLSGLISVLVFLAIKILVLNQEKPLEPGLKLLPLFYAFTAAINLFSVFYKGSACEYRESCSILVFSSQSAIHRCFYKSISLFLVLHFDRIPLYGVFIITFGAAIIVGIVVRIAFVPWYRKKIQSKYKPIYINDEIGDIILVGW